MAARPAFSITNLRTMYKQRTYAAPIIAAILLLLPLLYVGVYLALVVPGGVLITGEALPGLPPPGSYRSDQNYRLGGTITQWIFWPVEQVDRSVRSTEWDPSHWRPGDIE